MTALRRTLPLLAALLVGAGVFLLLLHVNPFTEMTDDGTRDLLFARDCVELGKCHLIGPATSVRIIYQGADWVDLLTAVKLLGGDVDAARIVVLLLNAAAIATLFLILFRWLKPSLALPSALLATGVLLVSEPAGQLINPSAAIFPDVLCEALLLLFVLTSRTAFLLGAAIALGVAVNFHIAALSLVPSLFVLASLASRRPIREGLLAATMLAGVAVSSSWDAWYANIMELSTRHHLSLALVLLVLVCVPCALFGEKFRSLSDSMRAWTTGVVLLLPFVAGTYWLGLQEGHGFFRTYLHPIIAPGATLVVALVAAPFALLFHNRLRFLPGLAPWAALLLLTWAQRNALPDAMTPRQAGSWRQSDIHRMAAWMTHHDWTFEQLLYRTQGPNCRELVTGAGAYLPPPKTDATLTPSRALRVFLRDRFTAGEGAIPLGDGRTAVLSEIASWLRPEAMLTCRVPPDGKNGECTHVPPRVPFENVEPDRFEFLSRAFPGLYVLKSNPPYTMRYEIPVIPDGSGARTIEVIDRTEPPCIWKIVGVENLTAEGPLPATRVTLHSSGTAPGSIAVEKQSGFGACADRIESRDYPPCLLETTPADLQAERRQ